MTTKSNAKTRKHKHTKSIRYIFFTYFVVAYFAQLNLHIGRIVKQRENHRRFFIAVTTSLNHSLLPLLPTHNLGIPSLSSRRCILLMIQALVFLQRQDYLDQLFHTPKVTLPSIYGYMRRKTNRANWWHFAPKVLHTATKYEDDLRNYRETTGRTDQHNTAYFLLQLYKKDSQGPSLNTLPLWERNNIKLCADCALIANINLIHTQQAENRSREGRDNNKNATNHDRRTLHTEWRMRSETETATALFIRNHMKSENRIQHERRPTL